MGQKPGVMKVVVLGSGTSTGVPVIGCECEVCQSKAERNQRTRASLAVTSSSGATTLVIDTATEFRLQVLRAGIKKVDAVLYTHIHADHCHGFDDLRAFSFREKKVIPCFLGVDHEQEFRARFQYAFDDTGYNGSKPQITLERIPEGPFQIGDLSIDPIILPHGHVRTWGFRIGNFAYATDFKTFSEDQIARWRGKIKTMVASGIHFGRHSTHSVIPETIELFRRLDVQHGVITHLAHEIDYLRDGERLPSHVEFAYDGMTIDV